MRKRLAAPCCNLLAVFVLRCLVRVGFALTVTTASLSFPCMNHNVVRLVGLAITASALGCGGSATQNGSPDARIDGNTNPGLVAADPCNPVSQSTMLPRVSLQTAASLAHQNVPPAPANGTVNVTRTSAGKPSRIAVEAPGTADDYTDDLTYTSAGLLSRFSHDASGTTADFTDDYTYTSAGLISRFSHDASGTAADATDDFTYTSAGRLSRFAHDAAGTPDDITEDFTYSSAGLISRFSHDAAGTAADVTEDFTYSSSGRLSRWTFDTAGSNDDASIDVSYDASSMTDTITTHGARATGAVIRRCI
jgi:hypothetical protein